MKAITINVSEPVLKLFKQYAKERDRTTSELIREAMEEYIKAKRENLTSLASVMALGPLSLGKIKKDIFNEDTDILGEMLND